MKPKRKLYPEILISSLLDESTDQEVRDYGLASFLSVDYETKFGETFRMKPEQQN